MVDFFFVLSGFVIFYSYGSKLGGLNKAARFLWLRVGRLYPLHFAFLLVFVGIEVVKLAAERKLGLVADKPAFTVNNGYAFGTNLLLIHSLGFNHTLTYNYPSWSISTEFYAYVLFCIVRSLFESTRMFCLVALAIIGLCTSVLLRMNIIPLINAGVEWGFLRCCIGFFLGTLTCLVYARYRSSSARKHSWLSTLSLGAIIVVLASIDPDGASTYSVPWLSSFVILSTVLWPTAAVQSLLSRRPLVWLGRVSYSLYMVHAAVVWVVTQILTVVLKYPKIELEDGHGVGTPAAAGLLALALYLFAVLVLSHFTYRWIEKPFRHWSRRLADRWFSGGGAHVVAPPSPSPPRTI
jgi:peptidoglycan/LPS O-acetylase OafA/YrhL